jgi:hypothetical protein
MTNPHANVPYPYNDYSRLPVNRPIILTKNTLSMKDLDDLDNKTLFEKFLDLFK